MPTYPTPTPIDLAINLPVGAIEVLAGDRTDTVVTVSPTNPDKAVDVRGADETKVSFDGRRLTVTGPRPRMSWIGPSESVDLRVELPTGSRLTAEIAGGGVRTVGRLGATRIKAMGGPVELDATGDLWARAGHGSLTLGVADGTVEITADHGQIRIGAITGDATLSASHGNIGVGESGGDLEAKLSYGDLEISRALASVTAKTAYGSIELGEVSGGSIEVESGYGQIVIGVRPGVPAWLDLSSKAGRVRNELDGDRAPGAAEQTVSVRARTQYGDISIRRAH
jgi:Putative adhesin